MRQGGVWKIAQAHYYPEFDGPYEIGSTNRGGGELPVVPRHYTIDSSGVPPACRRPGAREYLDARRASGTDRSPQRRRPHPEPAVGVRLPQVRKMWDDVADLFADDGVVEVGGQGIWRGKAGVRRWLETMGPAGLTHGQLNDRVQFDVIVEIAPGGNEAWARGIELGLLGEADRVGVRSESIIQVRPLSLAEFQLP